MVLEQKMSEHNTLNAVHPDSLSAASKKMSLANKLKKQRKIRQSGGAESPIPNEGQMMSAKSPVRSPVRESGNNDGYPDKAAKSPTREEPAARASKSPTRDDSASAASASKSATASLLHNKRRAMHLAKSRINRPSSKGSSHNSDDANEDPTSSETSTSTNSANNYAGAQNKAGKANDAYAPYMRKMPASRPNIMEPSFSSPNATKKNNHSNLKEKTAAPEVSKPKSTTKTTASDNQQEKYYDHDVTPVESAESEELQQYKEEDSRPKPSSMQKLAPSSKNYHGKTPTEERAATNPQQEAKAVVRQDQRSRTQPYSYGARPESKAVEPTPPTSCHEEIVPWETDDEPIVKESLLAERPDDSDKMSLVSTGRSVISNGVVDYDESIMSLARLDNFRSRANQDKANKVSHYPGVSGGHSYNNQVVETPNTVEGAELNVESLPVSAASAAKAAKSWRPSVPEQKGPAPPARATSWKGKVQSTPVASFSKRDQTPQAPASASKFGGAPRQRPSWMKPDSGADKTPEPSSGIANSNQGASPARSSVSTSQASSYVPSAAKFSSSRSDVGVETTPVMPSIRRDSLSSTKTWKPSTSTKKSSFVAQAPSRPEELRAASPNPTWVSTRSDHDTCPVSPTPSQVSEADSAVEKSSSNVPKAKVWASKQQTPAWMKHASNVIPNQPAQAEPAGSRKKSTVQDGEGNEVKRNAPPAPKPRQFTSPPTIPKGAPRRQVQVAETVEPERVGKSPRRHSSSPAPPSWTAPEEPAAVEADAAEEKKESVATCKTKTWTVNKQTPPWMKKSKGEESSEKPPVPVATTKTWSAKKQTPAWLKQASGGESEVLPTPSPRRNSTPAWLKAGQQNSSDFQQKVIASPQPASKEPIVSGSPQSPRGRSRQTPEAGKDQDPSPSPAKTASKPRRASSSSFIEQRPATSPRAQSWRQRSPSLNGHKKAGVAKTRHSVAGDLPKAASVVKNQRSPSPGVAQLQQQIFVNKLGVGTEPVDKAKLVKPQKGRTSPSPQIKQFQQIIFSPEQAKNHTKSPEEAERVSPAQGWWKRVPNAPEVQTDHCEAPAWKHETSSVHDEHLEVSPSPTMMSEPLPAKKTWKRPPTSSVNPGAPSFLKDVAAFHSTSSPKLPAEPPLWQQPSPQAMPSPAENSRVRTPTMSASSPMHRRLVDEGSAELMVMPSTSTTSRDDVVSHQEDTKSLIQMAADSVLIADYEQAMQRTLVESKSDEEDESVGNDADDALPTDLPPEFQRALSEEREDKLSQQETSEFTQTETSAQDAETNDAEECDSKEGDTEQEAQEERQENLAYVGECSSDPIKKKEVLSSDEIPESSSEPQKESPSFEIVAQPMDHSQESGGKDMLGSSPSGEQIKVKEKANIADRARALLGWSEKRCEAYQSISDNSGSGSSEQPQKETEQEMFVPPKSTEEINHTSCPSTGFGVNDPNITGFQQDEDGFPCVAPASEANVRFDGSDFHSDAFGYQDWGEAVADEKKDASGMLQYWSPEPNGLDDSADWGNRDPTLDSIPMHSPEPVSAADKVIMTAERMLQKWSNGAEGITPGGFPVVAEDLDAEPLGDEWNPNANSVTRVEQDSAWDVHQQVHPHDASSHRATKPAPQVEQDSAWDVNQYANPQANPVRQVEQDSAWDVNQQVFSNTRASEREHRPDFMAYGAHDEAAWRSPPRMGHQHQQMSARREEMAMWGSPDAIDSTWGTPQTGSIPNNGHFDMRSGSARPQQPDPFFAANSQFDKMPAGGMSKQRKDVFDPFGGEEDDGFFQSGQLFSEPADDFVAVENFSPPSFAPVAGSRRYNSHVAGGDVFDTYYHPPQSGNNFQQMHASEEEFGNDLRLI